MKLSTAISISVFVIIQNIVAHATNYYVTTVEEINSALNLTQPGDTITMKNQVWFNVRIVFKTNGTEQDSVYLRAETPGRVVLSGASNLRIAGNYLVVEGLYFINGYSPSGAVVEFRNTSEFETNHSRLTNCAIVDYNPPSNSTDYKWISLYGTYNRVDHCYIRGKRHSGTTLVVWLAANPNYHKIDNNYFANRPALGINGGETIRVGTSDWSMYDSYTLVEKNYFEECDGEIEIISNKSCENIYRYNTFYRCDGTLTLRHGNRCTVESNFFIGKNKSGTGGVRIIGEDHKVYNNYFCGLEGSGFRSALSMVNGIPNSALNEYFQVKNAIVAFNSFINNRYNFTIGAGQSSTQNLPPENCVIANNAVKGVSSPLINYEDVPVNLLYEGNIMFGAALGISLPSGITIADPLFNFADDSLWRPLSTSPVIGAAAGIYSYVESDIDLQARTGNKDVGADQNSSEPILNKPLGPDDVGTTYLSIILQGPQIIQVFAGEDSLYNAVNASQPYDIIELATDGGIYQNYQTMVIDKPLTIQAAPNLAAKPVIQNDVSAGISAIFELKNQGALTLKNLWLNGLPGNSSLILAGENPAAGTYKLKVENCYLKDVSNGTSSLFRALPGTLADTILFRNCLFSGSQGYGIILKDEAINSGKYNVKYFEVNNSTFWNISGDAINIYGGDDNSSTPGPKVKINHCTFYNCGYNGSAIMNFKDVDGTEVVSSLLTYSSTNNLSLILSGTGSKIHYCDTFDVGPLSLSRGAIIGNGMLGVNPLFSNPSNGNFMLAGNSPVIHKAYDFYSMGDLRWDPTLVRTEDKIIIADDYLLEQNYPNPFNPSTRIEFSLPERTYVILEVFDLNGRMVNTLVKEFRNAGRYAVSWSPQNISSGIYYYRMITGRKMITKKMIYVK